MDLMLPLLLLAALVSRLFVLFQSGNLIDFDEATFALMAKRILEGEIPFYISGHSYSGSLASFVMAPFIALLGTQPLAIKLSSLAFFLVFITIQYFLLKTLFSRPVSAFSNLLIVCMPAGMYDISTRVWGGHAELWSFQAALLLLLHSYFERSLPRDQKLWILFAMGVLVGMAFWIGEIFLLFAGAFAIYFILRLWRPNESLIVRMREAFLLKAVRLPPWIKGVLVTLHTLLLLYLFLQAVNLLVSGTRFPGLKHLLTPWVTDPPFRIKEMKWIFYLLAGESLGLFFLGQTSSEARKAFLGKLAIAASGVLAGHLPAILFNSLGGEGLRIFHKSGLLTGPDFLSRLSRVFTVQLPRMILGPPGAWPILFLVVGMVGVVGFVRRRDFLIFWRLPRDTKPPYLIVFFLVLALTLLANVSSTLEAERYLAPAYLGLAVILGYFLGEWAWKRSKVTALVLAGLVGGYFLFTEYAFLKAAPKERYAQCREILDYLEKREIRGGQASRSLSYTLTFLSGEKVVFSTYDSPERYLPYERYTEKLWRRAYVFDGGDSTAERFRQNRNLLSKVKETQKIGPFVIYVVELPKLKEGGINLPYLEERPKPHFHFYLNELSGSGLS